MQISVTGRHMDITDAIRNYVESKFSKLERHFDHLTDIHVILEPEKVNKKAESTVFVSGAKLFAENLHEDMYAAIDGLVDKLDRQLVRHKEKLKDHHR